MTRKKLTAAEDQKLTEAAVNVRAAPGWKIVEAYLTNKLDETKTMLVTNQTAAVPNLQGRAQELIEILELMQRK